MTTDPEAVLTNVTRRDYFPSAPTIAARGGRGATFTSLRPSPPGETHGQNHSQEPDRRARRRRDDADHLAVHQGPADPPVPRRRAGLLRPQHPEPRRDRGPDNTP